jgi:F420-dependent oxidoreductase-like protein
VTGFGLQIPSFSYNLPSGAIFDRVVEHASAAEDSGFDSVWVMDHLYQLPMLGGKNEPMLEGYTLLGALAARTSRVDLGTLVTGVTYRNPAMLAKIVTTLDVVSSGRAICGLGAAWHDVEHEAFGFDFPSAGERLDRLEEALKICTAMFASEAPTFEGAHYRTHEVLNIPAPVRGRIPIMIGGGGEKRTLKLVAQYADMCNFFGDAEVFRHKIAVLREHCDAIGRDPASITVSRLGTLALTDSKDEADQMRKVAPVVTAGNEDEIAATIEGLKAAGVQYFIWNMPTATPETVARAGKLFASLR